MIPCTFTCASVNYDQFAQDVIEETAAENNTSSFATSPSSSSADPISNKANGSIFDAVAKIFNDGLELIKSIFLWFFPSFAVEDKNILDTIMDDEPAYVSQARDIEL